MELTTLAVVAAWLAVTGSGGSHHPEKEAHVARTEYHFACQHGQELTITLASTPGSGAIWLLVAGRDDRVSLREEREPSPGVGGQTDQHFILTFADPGTYTLDFDLKRPWEVAIQSRVRAIVTVG